MCQQCEIKPVYEFTNKRKLCKRCFLKYFQKKVLYIIRKFNLIRKEEVIGYRNDMTFRGAVLEDILNIYSEKYHIKLVKLPSTENKSKLPHKCGRQLPYNCLLFSAPKTQRVFDKKKISKEAAAITIDLEADKIIHELIAGNEGVLKKIGPINGKLIKPLYLFLDSEVELYANLRNLKFKKKLPIKDKISVFIDELEKKHPELKRAVVNSYLELYSS
ncbi:MAG TPA: hypothetical protein VJH65_00105 [Candidatus Nanoarchaeia archaeon]|nr:hypothetical protein [Candidatus Nanoarchaeia archaeon]